jgi:hypothetical protein
VRGVSIAGGLGGNLGGRGGRRKGLCLGVMAVVVFGYEIGD